MNPLRPLASPAYRPLFAAMTLTIFAQGAWALYLAMQTLDLGATAASLSSVVAWSGIGLLAGSLPAGVIADRFPKKKILLSVLGLNTLVATLTAGLAAAGTVTFWMLGLSAFVIGTTTAFFFPAYTALVPLVVPADDLMAVNGLEGATRPLIGQALAPAVVGAVIGAALPPAGGFVIAGALAVAFLAALRLPAPTVPDEPAGQPDPSPLRDLRDGLAYAARTRWIRSSVIFAALMGLGVTGPLEVLLPTLMRESHADGAALYGAVLAALGVGGLVGSLVAGSWHTPRRFLPAMVGAWTVGCLPLAAPAFTADPWLIGAGLALYGALIGIGMVIWGTVLQEHVPAAMLGRIASLDFFISIAFMPLSIALTGILSRHMAPTTLFLGAALLPLATAATLAALGQLRTPDVTDNQYS
ncbi:MFS transporter [Corynebacterium doosanense]|uniref:Arabinose ABC transporter permease n=1 Tax=Corynebacterium doosanense CAU 212 = DSM 45436 TaxID=558173 RepID=A0A097IIT1_9CORY|nr:MFS transporter [Corynebacterium doosanense]AIT62040.1 arabinose ABC transporter permease [Corynebacterium doosanense CAU 212 = DSM 45436]